jgi:hypothetical protein
MTVYISCAKFSHSIRDVRPLYFKLIAVFLSANQITDSNRRTCIKNYSEPSSYSRATNAKTNMLSHYIHAKNTWLNFAVLQNPIYGSKDEHPIYLLKYLKTN